jgi:hypothetical protein
MSGPVIHAGPHVSVGHSRRPFHGLANSARGIDHIGICHGEKSLSEEQHMDDPIFQGPISFKDLADHAAVEVEEIKLAAERHAEQHGEAETYADADRGHLTPAAAARIRSELRP